VLEEMQGLLCGKDEARPEVKRFESNDVILAMGGDVDVPNPGLGGQFQDVFTTAENEPVRAQLNVPGTILLIDPFKR
jgi:hypothetical protein